MPNWTLNNLIDYARKNSGVSGAGDTPKPELPVGGRSLGKKKDKTLGSTKYLVCIRDFRRKLADEDNLCAKYHIDALRYARVIPDDRPAIAKILINQTLVKTEQEEKVVIKIISYDRHSEAEKAEARAAIPPEFLESPI